MEHTNTCLRNTLLDERRDDLKISQKLANELDKIFVGLDNEGREHPDQTPLTIPIKFQGQETSSSIMQRLIDQSLSREAQSQELDTFEESNDFDVDDEFNTDENTTQYQLMEEEYIQDDRRSNHTTATRNTDNSDGDQNPEQSDPSQQHGTENKNEQEPAQTSSVKGERKSDTDSPETFTRNIS